MVLEEVIGMTLFPSNKYSTATFLLGGGSNGKSTFIHMIKALLGNMNYSSLEVKELNHRFKVAELTNKLANVGDDINSTYIEETGNFKKLVTGETIMVERKGEHPYNMDNYAKLIFSANEMFMVKDKSKGFTRRITIIPFDAEFKPTDADYDPLIEDKVTTDNAKNYLFKLGIEGVKRVFARGKVATCERIENIKYTYMLENDSILNYFENDNRDYEGMVCRELYSDYLIWCEGLGIKPSKINTFNKRIKTHFNLDNTKPKKINGKTTQVWTRKEGL